MFTLEPNKKTNTLLGGNEQGEKEKGGAWGGVGGVMA